MLKNRVKQINLKTSMIAVV